MILPLLPNEGYGPWGVWNPRKLWIVVVLVCGFSFAAFLAVRFWGARKGIFLTGILGGLASSTAVTVSLANQSRSAKSGGGALAIGAGLASMVMVIRIAVLIAVAGPSALPRLAPFLGAMLLGSAIAIVLLARRLKSKASQESGLTNPFQLREAIRFGIIYALVLLAVEAARRYAGSWGIVAAAILAGFADVDAITLSLAGMSGSGLHVETAAGAIALAALSNTVAKAGYAAVRGSSEYRRNVALILGASFLAGVIALVVLGPRP